MRNKGEQQIQGVSMSGASLQLTAQVTDVGKPLMSAQDACQKGIEVVFARYRSCIRNTKTGIETPMYERGNQSYIAFEAGSVVKNGSTAPEPPTFSRQGQLLR